MADPLSRFNDWPFQRKEREESRKEERKERYSRGADFKEDFKS